MNLVQFLNSISIEAAGELTWNMIVEAGYDTVEKINRMSIDEIAVVGEADKREQSLMQVKKIGEKTAIKIWNSLHGDRVQQLLPNWNWVSKQ